jgi:hypothetical protein
VREHDHRRAADPSGRADRNVLISTCSASTYGLNRLPSGTAIPPGRSYDFMVSAGCWDVGAGSVSGGGQQAYQRMQIQAGGGVNYTVQ